MIRIASPILLNLFLVLAATHIGAAEPRTFDDAVQPFLKTHCVRCHGAESQEGDFRLDTLARDFESEIGAQHWAEVIERMNSGEMPPEDEPQPKSNELASVIDWLAARIKDGELARLAKRNRVEHYRLSREEYAHTVYDLLGVHYDPMAPGAFTEDPEWHGFERIGSQLSLSPSHVEKYLAAAETIIDSAFPDTEPRQIKTHRDALEIDWPNRNKRKQLEELGIADRVRTLIWPGHRLSYLRPDGGHRQAAGIYRARIQLSGLAPKGGRAPHLALHSKKLDRMLFEADVLAGEHEPVILEFETFIPEGRIDVTINNEVPGPSNAGRSGRPGGFVFTTLDDPKSRAPWQRKMTDDEGNPLYPLLIFDWIEWEGPITRPEDLAKRRPYFPTEDANLAQTCECLTRFAERAWRRPTRDREIDRYMRIVESELTAGEPLRTAVKSALVGILVSNNFYYIREGSPAKSRPTLNDWELATRLSYFLWSSLPDDELFAVARAGQLQQPEQLRKQLMRMLADPKTSRFTDSFPRQWLQLKKVGMFPPDTKLFPDYDPWLEQSMVLETTGFFAEVLNRNLSIREFLDSDWTILNPRLALHYGLQPLSESGFQRVSLNPEDHRGGILTQAATLSLSSDGTRHRPVHRGVWVSEAIFGKTPSPPPANVDPIEPNPVDEPKATIRMKLEAHQSHASCAACHRKIDPLGLAFDNYDAIGRWRTEEVVATGQGANPPVDASGKLSDGRAFNGPEEFKALLVDDIDAFGEAMAGKLATYALRRAMSVDDREQIRVIAETAKANDYRLRDLIEQLVLSDLFRKR